MSCPFCEINEKRNKIIWEGKHVFVTLSNPRLMLGHTLVIPKRHVEKLSELYKEEKEELFETAIKFQERVLSKISSGCDIRVHYRPFQKQNNLKVNHLHLHIRPRELEDNLYQKSQIFEKEIFTELSDEEFKKTSGELK